MDRHARHVGFTSKRELRRETADSKGPEKKKFFPRKKIGEEPGQDH